MIAQHFYWECMRKTVQQACSACDQCQCAKRKTSKCGKLPGVKQVEVKPWQTPCVGPHMLGEKNKEITTWAITMIDPATSWIDIALIETKWVDVIANLCEQYWLTRCPRLDQVMCDCGTEFMVEFATTIEQDYDILKKLIAVRNSKANHMVERTHLTVGNTMCAFDVPCTKTAQDQIPGTLAAISHGICSAMHATNYVGHTHVAGIWTGLHT